ncbi:MAG: hypothetical protein A2Y62_18625 [Candidatus Fischerbacteria bacterium RBG_13_37_8]|uniref:Uncharacterized protein n=1 Tax=Candidatus Fischerbacteria bacterium RBG_13_37_8 TaxID=1817863 RepID=A0A1F5V4J5_9BACT|nr:MAG: hypothetical protein A2Y62_18625 [Candidatus Fischerbacteria bacterium RBG_13_37_8]
MKKEHVSVETIEKTFELYISGKSNLQIARILGAHRNSITKWIKDYNFEERKKKICSIVESKHNENIAVEIAENLQSISKLQERMEPWIAKIKPNSNDLAIIRYYIRLIQLRSELIMKWNLHINAIDAIIEFFLNNPCLRDYINQHSA